MKAIRCPICKTAIVIEIGVQKLTDAEITKAIDNHTYKHTIGDILEFVGLNMAQQVLDLQTNCENKTNQEKNNP